MLIGKADALVPSGHPEVMSPKIMSRGMVLEQELVREQVGEQGQRWHPGNALLVQVCLSLVLWGSIIGGLDWLL